MVPANVLHNVTEKTVDRTVAVAHALRDATTIKAASRRLVCVTASPIATASNAEPMDVEIAAATARPAQAAQTTVVVPPVRTNVS